MNSITLCRGEFRKATRSQTGGGDCVLYARKQGTVFLRDDKAIPGSPDDHILAFPEREFDAFQTGVRTGTPNTEFLLIEALDDGMYVFRNAASPDDAELVFDQGELDAFLDGVTKREFDADTEHVAHADSCCAVQLVAV